MRRRSRIVSTVTILLATPLLLYALATVIGGLVPVNAGWRPPPRGVTIWVEDNGIHTGLVLPKVAAGIDWHGDFPAADLADPRYARHDHVAIGWGERNFYVGTPTWADLKPAVVLAAATGSDAVVLHVEHVARPVEGEAVRAVTLRPIEYHRLAALIRAARRPGVPDRGYGGHDAFYPAAGRYDAVRTCNEWTRRTLAKAGVRVGAWTPAPWGVMRWF